MPLYKHQPLTITTPLPPQFNPSLHPNYNTPQLQYPQDQLAHFDFDGEHLLYEIRMLTAQQRADVAAYIVQRRLTPPQAQMLSRAVKEYERRRSERDGFSSAPGDVLAFKYFRDAAECRREDEKQRCIDKGLDVAVTEGARRRLVCVFGCWVFGGVGGLDGLCFGVCVIADVY